MPLIGAYASGALKGSIPLNKLLSCAGSAAWYPTILGDTHGGSMPNHIPSEESQSKQTGLLARSSEYETFES